MRVSGERLSDLVARRNLGPGISHNEVADMIDDLIEARLLLGRAAKIRLMSDAGTPLVSNQGQALDGFSELAEYRAVAAAAEKLLRS